MLKLTSFPFLTMPQALLLLRVAIAIFFMAHAAVRLVGEAIPQFGHFLSLQGFPYGVAWVWAITIFELSGGMLMALGYQVRIMAAGFMLIAVGGIVLIHAKRGWFVGEHGTGGMEYSLCLLVGLIVIAAASREKIALPK
jgi:putative oxidoreductase